MAMKAVIEAQENIDLKQAMVERLVFGNNRVVGVVIGKGYIIELVSRIIQRPQAIADTDGIGPGNVVVRVAEE